MKSMKSMKSGEHMSENTIAAIATANGIGGIGVIRVSGEQARNICDKIFVSVSDKKLTEMKGYTATYGHVYEEEELLDDAVALVFTAPNSYTGEDVVEISCHGGMYITKRVLRAILKAGAVAAQAGEFTKRAFLNGKMGLTEAEAVMDIIGAKGEQSVRAARACMDGALRKRIDALKDILVNSTAHLAAWADYPEEDIPQIHTDTLKQNLKSAENEMTVLLSQYDTGKIMKQGVDTVIAGRPNVGKSTLMNLLSGCERSIVTEIPGTTRDIIEETVMLGEIPLNLSDTAGLRSTADPIEKIGVEKARQRILNAGLVLAVFDASRALSDEDNELLNLLATAPAVAVINKTDLEQKLDIDYIKSKISHVVLISALNGDGGEALEKAVADIVGTAQLDASQGILANERQRDAAEKAKRYISEAIEALNSGVTLDAVTIILEDAVQALLELTGESVNDTIVDTVFSHFCVGK